MVICDEKSVINGHFTITQKKKKNIVANTDYQK